MKPRVPYSDALADRILDGLAAGQGLRALCAQPDMPTRPTVMRWFREKPEFADAAAYCRKLGGLDRPGRPCGHTPALIDEIYLRLCEGEPLRTICRDPHLPSRSTMHTWMRRRLCVAHAVDLGRDNAIWLESERRWDQVKHLFGM